LQVLYSIVELRKDGDGDGDGSPWQTPSSFDNNVASGDLENEALPIRGKCHVCPKKDISVFQRQKKTEHSEASCIN
jgi:hypothetical protein